MIDELTNDLKVDEGWEPSVYQDHLGYWTLGFGFLVDDRKGGEIPVSIAEQWLQLLIDDKLAELYERHPWVGSQPEDVQRALGNMCYQMGVGGVSNFRNMLSARLRLWTQDGRYRLLNELNGSQT